MALSAVFVFIYTRLGGDNITGFYLMSVRSSDLQLDIQEPGEHIIRSFSRVNIVHCLQECLSMEEELYQHLPFLQLPEQHQEAWE